MRIRLTIDIERRRPEPAEVEREAQVDALVERSEPPRIGFTANPGRIEPEDRR